MKRISTTTAVALLVATVASAQVVDMKVMAVKVAIDGAWVTMNVAVGETGDLMERVAELHRYCSKFRDLAAVLSGTGHPDDVSEGLYVLPGADDPVYLVKRTTEGILITTEPRVIVMYYGDQDTMYYPSKLPCV